MVARLKIGVDQLHGSATARHEATGLLWIGKQQPLHHRTNAHLNNVEVVRQVDVRQVGIQPMETPSTQEVDCCTFCAASAWILVPMID